MTPARSLSDTFAGMAPHSVPLFVAAQGGGAVLGVVVFGWLLPTRTQVNEGANEPAHLS